MNNDYEIYGFIYAAVIYMKVSSTAALVWMMSKISKQENGYLDLISGHFVFALTLYRCAQIFMVWLVWGEFADDLVFVCLTLGNILLTIDFVYYYVKAYRNGKHFQLPN